MIKFRNKYVTNFQIVTKNDITEEMVRDKVYEKTSDCPTLFTKGSYVSFCMIVNKMCGHNSCLVTPWSKLRDAIDATNLNRKIYNSQPETIYVYGTALIESDGVNIFEIDGLETSENF